MSDANKGKKIIMLATACDLSNMIYNRLSTDFLISAVVIEKNISKTTVLKRRMKKLGVWEVMGQILFLMLVAKPMRFFSKRRIRKILEQSHISDQDIPVEKIKNVSSVNDEATIKLLQEEDADLIVVNGTRIISSQVINSVKGTFVNIHAGITPLYRGVHGGYWAMAMNDKAHCGMTIHYVDTGIDTGGILEQGFIHPGPTDNFITYPYLQFTSGADLFAGVVKKFVSGTLQEIPAPAGASKLWYHPTLWAYVYYRIIRGVK